MKCDHLKRLGSCQWLQILKPTEGWVPSTYCDYLCSAPAVELARQTLCKGYSCWCSVLQTCWGYQLECARLAELRCNDYRSCLRASC